MDNDADTGADAIVVETMCDVVEARLAVEAAKSTGLPVVACMVFDSGKDQDRTMMGATPEKVAEELITARADAIGANCGQGPAAYVNICRRMRATCNHPIWIKPNAGLPHIEGEQVVYKTTPAEFAEYGPARFNGTWVRIFIWKGKSLWVSCGSSYDD